MIFKKKNDKLNFDTVVGIRDVVDHRETMVVQVSFAIDLTTGSAHSFVNVLSRELYLKN